MERPDFAPCDILYLLHAHCFGAVYNPGAPSSDRSKRRLLFLGLIEERDGGVHTTERGKSHVEVICHLALPVRITAFINPMTKEIINP